MTAGLVTAPKAELDETASRLLEGAVAAPFLDREPPPALDRLAPADSLVAIGCEVAGAEQWHLRNR